MLGRLCLPALFAILCPLSAMAGEGKFIYTQTCAQCHKLGSGGAPKLADKVAWQQRIEAGRENLLTSALKGKGAMPPKGGNASNTDADIRAALDYMLSELK